MNIVREQAMPTEVVVDTGADTPAGLSDRDRHFVTELVYGTTRLRRACDHLVDRRFGVDV